MQKHKDICKPPYYSAVDPQTMHFVQQELRVALPILHSKMMQSYSCIQEEYIMAERRRGLGIQLQEK